MKLYREVKAGERKSEQRWWNHKGDVRHLEPIEITEEEIECILWKVQYAVYGRKEGAKAILSKLKGDE